MPIVTTSNLTLEVEAVTHAAHRDSGAYTATTSSLTLEVEAVTHAAQWLSSQRDTKITHATTLAESMNLLQKGITGRPD